MFVSEAMVDGENWYRLRVGSDRARAEAERLLNLALPDYPRAWLAIGDDAVTSDGQRRRRSGAAAGGDASAADPPLPPDGAAEA